jgi:hypothetical protein
MVCAKVGGVNKASSCKYVRVKNNSGSQGIIDCFVKDGT